MTDPTTVEPSSEGRERPEPLALRFAWLIVTVAAVISIVLVATQMGGEWPFDPTVRTTIREVLDSADRRVSLTERVTDDGGARDALFRAVAGIAALTAGLLAWGRLEQSRRQHDLDRDAADRAVHAQRLATRAQVTERFARTVDQLSAVAEPARIGALFALERLAVDAPAEAATIYDVICAYARHHSTVARADGRAADLRTAIMIALRAPTPAEQPLRRSLRGVVIVDTILEPTPQLTDVDFADSTWRDVSFAAAADGGDYALSRVKFDHATLEDVTFPAGTRLDQVTFARDATLTRVNFDACDLESVTFDATLEDVNFDAGASDRIRVPQQSRGQAKPRDPNRYPHLNDVRFSGTISRARFGHARVDDVVFRAARIDHADLGWVEGGAITFGSGLHEGGPDGAPTWADAPTELVEVTLGGTRSLFSRDVRLWNVRFDASDPAKAYLGHNGLPATLLEHDGGWYTPTPPSGLELPGGTGDASQ